MHRSFSKLTPCNISQVRIKIDLIVSLANVTAIVLPGNRNRNEIPLSVEDEEDYVDSKLQFVVHVDTVERT